ncbi:MAG: hypothetical protein DRO14_01800 [Thermoprotei archaeon]|nr:MAG: hypothetical protein DRO14_01800 [Thermoprotei archaeon]
MSEALASKLSSKIASEISEVLPSDVVEQSSILSSFIGSSGRDIIVTNAGSFASPARFLVLCLRNMTSRNAIYFTPQELMYYVAPYDEGRESDIVIFAAPDGLNTLNLLIDQVKWTGHRVCTIIAADNVPQVISYKISTDSVIYIKNTTKSISWLLQTHVLVGLAVTNFISRRGVRGKRLWEELTNIKAVIGDLLEHYVDDLTSIKEFMATPHLITASPTMWGVAEYLAYSNIFKAQRFLARPHEIKNFIRFINKVLLITTDVEEYSMKELKGLAITAATVFKELKVRTDPLTAPVYGLILARALELLMEQ